MSTSPLTYTMALGAATPDLAAATLAPHWLQAEEGRIAHFHDRSSDHHPEVRFRVLYDETAIYVRFDVADRYVRSVQTVPNGDISVMPQACSTSTPYWSLKALRYWEVVNTGFFLI